MGGSKSSVNSPVLTYRIEIRPNAIRDVERAAAWYEQQEPGLGERFIREVFDAAELLAKNPLVYRVRHQTLGIRWCYPAYFPYRIVFRCSGNRVIIAAVLHAAQQEPRWRKPR